MCAVDDGFAYVVIKRKAAGGVKALKPRYVTLSFVFIEENHSFARRWSRAFSWMDACGSMLTRGGW